jgi:uncharacterized protein (UPF0254 family)
VFGGDCGGFQRGSAKCLRRNITEVVPSDVVQNLLLRLAQVLYKQEEKYGCTIGLNLYKSII